MTEDQSREALEQLRRDFEELSIRAAAIRDDGYRSIANKIRSLCDDAVQAEELGLDADYAESLSCHKEPSLRLAGLMALSVYWRFQTDRLQRVLLDRLASEEDNETLRYAVSLAETCFKGTERSDVVSLLRHIVHLRPDNGLLTDQVRWAISAIMGK